MARTHYSITRHCHNTECNLFNVPVDIRVTRATWEQPEEWYDDPECKSCASNLDGEYNEYEYDEEFYLPDDYEG